MTQVVLTSVSSRLKLGFFLLVVGFALCAGGSLWAFMSVHHETKALSITAAVCLIVGVACAGVGLYLEELYANPAPSILAGLFGFFGCVLYIAAASLRINWRRTRSRADDYDHYRAAWKFPDYDYPCALVILGAIFALLGAIFCFLNLAKLRMRSTEVTEMGERRVVVTRGRDTDGDGRVDRIEKDVYTTK